MSGVSVIRYLLANNAPVLAVIPATRIMAGVLPVNTIMPALSITQISSIPLNLLKINEPNKMHNDRVQVTAMFKDVKGTPVGTGYPGLKSMLRLVLAACPSQRGIVNGVNVDSITPSIEGADFYDDVLQVHICTRDFFVKWNAT